MDSKQLQELVNESFEGAFGRTPLRQRLDDILGEAIELHRMSDVRNLKEEAGDLLASAIQLCSEASWNFDDLVLATLDKIRRRKEQYRSLGRKLKVAILGGAFDPPTTGHIKLAQFVLNTSQTFDEVWLMPCCRHMNGKKMTDPTHRLEMCRIASSVDGRIKVFDFEIQKQLAGQTYHFVKLLLEEALAKDQCDFSIIMGMDNANNFPTWPDYSELEKMIRFVVVPRTGIIRNEAINWYLKPPHIYLSQESDIPATASTNVRAWLSEYWHDQSLPVSPELDSNVLSYVTANNLYKS